jgi:Nudix hydrolase domain
MLQGLQKGCLLLFLLSTLLQLSPIMMMMMVMSRTITSSRLMADAFRSASSLGRCRHFGSSSSPCCSSRLPAESLFRRTAGIAVLAVVSSATALAAHDRDDTHVGLANGKSRNLTTTYCEEEEQDVEVCFPMPLLTLDHYNGVIIHLDRMLAQESSSTDEALDQDTIDQRQLYQQLSQDPEAFLKVMETSLMKWKAQGKKGIWIHLPPAMAAVVPVSSIHITTLSFLFFTDAIYATLN